MAAPVTYTVGEEQYVAVLAGTGGSLGGHFVEVDYENEGRLLAWKLGGKSPLPPVRSKPAPQVAAPRLDASPEVIARGQALYARHCMRCHGMGVVSAGLYPDLRHATKAVHAQWSDIVLGGTRQADGMASFADVLSQEDAATVHAYVAERALAEPNLLARALDWALDLGLCLPASWLAD